jgi:hypothetical protein
MAFEAQTRFKYHPRILKRLVLINMITERYDVAQKFLDLLSCSLIHKKWANHYQKYIDLPSLTDSDPMIQLKRAQLPKADFFINNKSPNQDLFRMVMEDSNNKMAFEYLMAYYLLDCRLLNLVQYLPLLKHFGYRRIPRHIEEALLLIKIMSPSQINIDEYQIRPETIERFIRFHQILEQHLGNEKEAQAVLTKEFRDTYWYYVRYVNPKKTGFELKSRKIHE